MRIKALAAALLLMATDAALADPPGRVGRLSFSDGTVWHRGAEHDPWAAAPLNFPVTSGASFRTELTARAEIQIGAVELRMDRATALDVPLLDDEATRFRIADGVVNLRVRTLPEGGVQAETARGTVSLLQPGRYRIASRAASAEMPGGHAELAVLEGHAQLAGPDTTLDLKSGQSATVVGEPPHVALGRAEPLPFDQWAMDRERTVSPVAGRHVSPETTGWQDLDAHGEWRTVPSYGSVWCPTGVPAGWAPYRHGHWAFISPWGWTWIDEAPWGFAPFHYGRWLYLDDRWAWWPGRAVARPVYAPALVVFVGRARHGHAGRHRHHHVGWVPLGPHEAFRPHYRATSHYQRRVNAGVADRDRHRADHDGKKDHPVAVNTLANRRAATMISRDAFVGSVPVHRTSRSAGAAQLVDSTPSRDLGDLRPARRPAIAAPAQPAKPPAARPLVAKPQLAKPAPAAPHQAPERTGGRDERKAMPSPQQGRRSHEPVPRNPTIERERAVPRATVHPPEPRKPERPDPPKRVERSLPPPPADNARRAIPSVPRNAAQPSSPPPSIAAPARAREERGRASDSRAAPAQVQRPQPPRPRQQDARPVERRQFQSGPAAKPPSPSPQRQRDSTRTADGTRGAKRP